MTNGKWKIYSLLLSTTHSSLFNHRLHSIPKVSNGLLKTFVKRTAEKSRGAGRYHAAVRFTDYKSFSALSPSFSFRKPENTIKLLLRRNSIGWNFSSTSNPQQQVYEEANKPFRFSHHRQRPSGIPLRNPRPHECNDRRD
jgi:hypothetical protein